MRISVGVICYNHEPFLSQCLDSLLEQTLQPQRIIIADDCSTDHSWDVIQSYQSKYPDVINGYRNATNRGAFRTGTFVEKNLSGDFVSLMDGDDFWFPEKIEFEYKAICENNADVAHSDVTLVNLESELIGVWTKRHEIQPSGDVFVNVLGRRYFRESKSIFRNELVSRKAFDSDGWVDGTLHNFWDWERKIRYSHKYRTAHTNKNLVAYRLNPLGISRSHGQKKLFKAMVQVYEKHQPLLDNRSVRDRFFVRTSFELEAAKQREQLGICENEHYAYTAVFKRLYDLLCELKSEERVEMLHYFAHELFVDLAGNLSRAERQQLFNAFAGEITTVKAILEKAVNA